MSAPEPRPLTLPEQRALEALGAEAGSMRHRPARTHGHAVWRSLEARGMVIDSAGLDAYLITDRGRRYLAILNPGGTP